MNDWYRYMLLWDQKIFYVGITNDVHKRLMEHFYKQSFFTKKFSDLKFVYAEKYQDKYIAAKREKQIKGGNKLGINSCTGLVEVLLRKDENLVSLLRA